MVNFPHHRTRSFIGIATRTRLRFPLGRRCRPETSFPARMSPGRRFPRYRPSPVRLTPVYDRLHSKYLFVAAVLEQNTPVADAETPLAVQPLQTKDVPNARFRELIQRCQHSGLRRWIEPSQVPPRPAGKIKRPGQAPNSRLMSSRVKVRPAAKSSVPSSSARIPSAFNSSSSSGRSSSRS